jgi:hypothetical protein
MRAPFAIPALLLLGACVAGGDRRAPPPRPAPSLDRAPGGADADDPSTRQCLAELARSQVRFRALEDRRFDGGCSALGSVQLLEIGTPVTNLGAMTCPLARAFARWVRESVQPSAARHFGSPVRRVETFGTYACRPVNGRPGARTSEHGLANAVDVAAFVLADGRRVSVETGWRGEDGMCGDSFARSTKAAAGASPSASAPIPTPIITTISISTWGEALIAARMSTA